MANVSIPNLPPVIALNGNEQIEVVQGGTSSRATVAQITQYQAGFSPTYAALASASGSGLVGFQESATGSILTNISSIIKQGMVSLANFAGADPSGATSNTTAFNNAAAYASSTGRGLYIPAGTWRFDTVATIPGNLVIEGAGEDTVLVVGANNINLLQAIAGGKVKIYNLRLVGDGTASSSSVGIGLRVGLVDSLILDTVWLDTFGQAGVFVQANNTLRTDIQMRNIKATNGQNPRGGANADIMIYGFATNIYLENIQGATSGLTPMGSLIQITEASANQNVYNIQLHGIRTDGYGRQGVAIANENTTADFQSGKVQVSDVRIINNGWEGFKTKNVDFLQIDNLYTENCELSSTEAAGNLQGSVLINGANTTVLSNITTVNCGTDGLRIIGRVAGSVATGVGMAAHTINGLNVWTAAQKALFVGQFTADLSVNGLVATDTGGVAIRSAPTFSPPKNITLNNPIIRRTVGNNAGIEVTGLVSPNFNVGPVTINSPDINGAGGFGISSSYCDVITIQGGSIQDSGTGGVNVYGISASNTTTININGLTKNGNLAGTTQTYGIFLGGNVTTAQITNNNLGGNVSGPFSGTTPTTLIARNNQSWLQNPAFLNSVTATINLATSSPIIIFNSALTADATITLVGTGLPFGYTCRLQRGAGATGAFNIIIAGVSPSSITLSAINTGVTLTYTAAGLLVQVS